MTNKNKKSYSISTSYKKWAVWGIVITAISITLNIITFNYLDYSDRITTLESEYLQAQKEKVKQVVLNATHYINHLRSGAEDKLKARIKSRVYEAHAIATNIYEQYQGQLTDTEIKKLIITALRPIRFFDNKAHYFIQSSNGVVQLHPGKPYFEGTNRLHYKDSNGQYVIEALWSIIDKSDEGFYSYGYSTKQNQNLEKTKTSFVKHFKPFNWLIGTGDYLDNVDRDLQTDALEYIKQVTFGKNSYIFVVNYTGTVVMNVSQPHLIGKNIWNLADPNGVMVIQEERKAVENPEGDFIYYVWNKPSTSTPSPKISFMKGIVNWQWMIGAGVYVDDISLKVSVITNKLRQRLVLQTFLILLLTAFITLVIIMVFNKISLKFDAEINLFINFFSRNKLKTHKIDIEQLKYYELKELGISANQMVDAQNEAEIKRAAAEQSLRSSEFNLKEAQRVTHLGNWECDLSTRSISASEEFLNVFGIQQNRHNFTLDLLLNKIHPADKDHILKSFDASIKHHKTFDEEYRIVLNNHKERVVRVYGETFYDMTGKALKISGIAQDITEIREKEIQLRRIQKMDAVGQLTGGIAHDFNNILGIILGNLSFLQKEIEFDKRALDRVNRITRAAQRAADLTKQLLGFSRKHESAILSTDINQVIKGMHDLITRSLTPEVEVNQHFSDALWMTKIDIGELEDALLNLILNARDAMQGKGRLSIETSNCILDEGYTSLNADVIPGEYVQLAVSDTGKGMTQDLQEHIYEPFFTTKPTGKGTGLGLSMVFGFTKRSGGHIKVYSEIGVGTTFRLYLPRCSDTSEQKNDLTVKPDTLPQGNETILIVDDEEGLLELAKESLQSLGYHVFTAKNGQQATVLLEKEPSIALLFSDIVMPGGLNGYQLAEKAVANNKNLKIILTSGYTEKSLSHNGQADFNTHLLSKPYTQSELAQKVRSLLGPLKTPYLKPNERPHQDLSSDRVITLNKTLSNSNNPVDDDHQLLLDLLNRFIKLEDNSANTEKLTSIFNELIDYTKHHFIREEVVMQACEYPGLKNHYQVHQLLLKQIEEKFQQHERNSLDLKHIQEFLQNLLLEHIQGMDKAFTIYSEGKADIIEEALLKLDTNIEKGITYE